MEYNEYLMLREDILKWIQKRLKPSRYKHTLGVEQLAVTLARRYQEDPMMASLAALLHDNAKNLTLEKQLKICKHAYPDANLSMEYSSVLHAFAGAAEARKKYPALPEDVFNAICYHTTGRPNMSKLEKIIYTADFAEPNRAPFEGLEDIRRALLKDLEEGFMMVLTHTLGYVEERGKPMHPLSVETLAFYEKGKE